jgi:anti-anti-sigma factor
MSESLSQLEVSIDGSSVVVTGDLDAHTCPKLDAALDPLPGSGDVEVDMSAVSFMDSSGLRALIGAHQTAESEERRVVVRKPSPPVARLIEVSGLSGHLHVVDTD